MRLSIIILNYNTPKLVIDCVSSIQQHLKIAYEIIIVDNGSHSPVEARDIKKFRHTRLIEQSINLGFGGGNNLGAQEATGEYLWILNSDTILVDNSVERLLTWMDERPDVGIASPLLYLDYDCTEPQRDMYANFQSFKTLVTRRNRTPYRAQADGSALVDMVVGAAMIVRRSLYEQLGGFDEKIFMYLEDDDICRRARKAGFRTAVYTKAQLVHLQGKSIAINAKRKMLYYQSQSYYWRKHHGLPASIVMRAMRLHHKRKNMKRD
jgi:GT2 family glycosyltransferase